MNFHSRTAHKPNRQNKGIAKPEPHSASSSNKIMDTASVSGLVALICETGQFQEERKPPESLLVASQQPPDDANASGIVQERVEEVQERSPNREDASAAYHDDILPPTFDFNDDESFNFFGTWGEEPSNLLGTWTEEPSTAELTALLQLDCESNMDAIVSQATRENDEPQDSFQFSASF